MAIRLKIIGLVVLVALAAGSCSHEKKGEELNILLLCVDTLRADHLRCYGYDYPTSPHLDALAEKSLFFRYAYCPIPKTSASFASMLTGLHPFIHKTKPNRGYLKEKYLTLAETLKREGYYNMAVVDNANLSRKFLFHQGFDRYIEVWDRVEEKAQSTPFITGEILSFLKKNKKRPFFLWANYIETHTPYAPPEEYIESRPRGRDIRRVRRKVVAGMRKVMKEKPVFDEGHYISLYDGAVKYIDAELGKIIDQFFKGGFHENTILIISADHGEDLGERNYYFNHGPLTFNAASRVPLMVYVPGIKPRKIKTPVSIMDIYPTLLNRLSLKPPYPLQGIDLFKAQPNRSLLMIGQGTYGVVENNYHYVKVFPRLSRMLGQKNLHLYDIYADPYETHNTIAAHKTLSRSLDQKYRAYYNKHGYRKGIKDNGEKPPPLSEKDKKSLKTLGYL